MSEEKNTIAYNITIKVRWNISEAWLEWQKATHIPAHLATGCFDSYKLFQLLDQDEEEGPTFILQLFTSSEDRYAEFMTDAASQLQRAAQGKWGDGFIAFRTLMRSVG